EDKVARRGVRLGDVFHRERFAAKLGEVMDYHNFILRSFYNAEPVDFQKTLDDTLAQAEDIRAMVCDVTATLHGARER
ncbi:MAG TPA: adenylosuccinate synthase, partial [Alcanivorax sp.]|nr:adenylosuccinate synthase [Alcanivorax sp.]